MKESRDTQKQKGRQMQDYDEEIPMLTKEDIRRLDKRWEGIPLDQPLRLRTHDEYILIRNLAYLGIAVDEINEFPNIVVQCEGRSASTSFSASNVKHASQNI